MVPIITYETHSETVKHSFFITQLTPWVFNTAKQMMLMYFHIYIFSSTVSICEIVFITKCLLFYFTESS